MNNNLVFFFKLQAREKKYLFSVLSVRIAVITDGDTKA